MTQFEQTMAKLEEILGRLDILEERSKPDPNLLPERGLNNRLAIPSGRIPAEVMDAADPALGPDSANVIAYARENFTREEFEAFFPHAVDADGVPPPLEKPEEEISADDIAAAQILDEEARYNLQ